MVDLLEMNDIDEDSFDSSDQNQWDSLDWNQISAKLLPHILHIYGSFHKFQMIGGDFS